MILWAPTLFANDSIHHVVSLESTVEGLNVAATPSTTHPQHIQVSWRPRKEIKLFPSTASQIKLSDQHTNTHTNTHSLTHSLTHTHTLSLSLMPSAALCLCVCFFLIHMTDCAQRPEGSETDPTCTCTISARPCCTSLAGDCSIQSQQYCEFVGGHFHPDAELCSQVPARLRS